MLNKLLLLGTAYAAAALSNATLNGIAADALWPEVATGCMLRADFTNRVVELTPEGPRTYGGGYTEYVAQVGYEAPTVNRD